MIEKIIRYSIHNKLIVLLFVAGIVGFGIYSLINLPIGAVPDITNNQVQVITTSRNLSTEDVEKFLTYPVELEMANLPEVKEIRSISKFGLSVVTIVFNDNINTFLPRQLIAEKIKNAKEKIPDGFGSPFMGPITTGLGEIYQYIIDVDSAYKDDYSLSDLRTLQDWVIRRQLSGIPGVIEVNTWGGYLKQYEVAVNPNRLRAINLSLSDIYKAIEKNNSIAGGAYIEKTNQSYFIRGEGLVSSLEDIENIVIEIRNETPIYIKDVAEVGFGHANRFGAITANGEGEKVLGQVMMLKDANSKKVIEAVKERVAEIQASLPEGVSINPVLDRSTLIGKTTFTIIENLTLGCLIVIFVVVLLMGNLRSGLVIASVIPLSLLFALSMMYIFGIDANLMSLGAIDFGIIIDGAVIIVEYISFKITSQSERLKKLSKSERKNVINNITFESASKMMKSAVFGQLIIIIVFIPILSLVNVEGKMFRPMALVFSFALTGAMILCFTYVPVISSMFIKAGNPHKKTISSRLITFLEEKYKPTMAWALRKKGLVVSLAATLLIFTMILYNTMGGEFVPTLDEGDFVIQPVLKTGTSLSKTIKTMTEIEKIVKTFPEVDQVVSRIGAAEVPTDPMSMEECDVIITLKDKSDWVSADSKDELANKIKEALSVIPGVDYEFTQPIEMRFNELITGVRADVAIKVFGPDLDILYNKALEIQRLISDIEGAADISVEKTAGLPQMTVKYDRKKVAKYGLNIQDLNDIITIGFAGMPAGTVFEGEKQFDLVVRFNKEYRNNIDKLASASIKLPNGNQVPLSEFAEITYTKGPAKISRDNTKRRIVVGVNVRNRDLESVVLDIQKRIKDNIKLPTGYSIDYGGQFENLKTASKRLKIAVPIALLLIFVLLYFAFSSVKEALLIYSAIPLASVGGVMLLFIRGMPFSISAGVGFIALFGIAVLNGIVLIEEFKELKAKGITNINRRILMGTKNRLRPVLLTASAAALGFLPMAISTSAGAEVQRPLATVVVGGLISATSLTLVVLPVLYAIFDRRPRSYKLKGKHLIGIALILISFPFAAKSQKAINLNEALEIATENNAALMASGARVQQSEALIKTAFDIDKTDVYFNYDQNNLAENSAPLNVFGISQKLAFPGIYSQQKNVLSHQSKLLDYQYKIDEITLKKQVSIAYKKVVFWTMMKSRYHYLDSLYQQFSYAAKRKYEEGGTNKLEHLTASAKKKEISVLHEQSKKEYEMSLVQFNKWLQSDTIYIVADKKLIPNIQKDINFEYAPSLLMNSEKIGLAKSKISLEKNKFFPDLMVDVFRGTNNAAGAKVYNGVQLGLALPIAFGKNRAQLKAAKLQLSIAEYEYNNYKSQLSAKQKEINLKISKYKETIEYYNQSGKQLMEEILLNANKSFKNGEINYLQYIQLLDNAIMIEINYLSNLINYDITIIENNYLTY
ncbi:MAG: CusA/CzcA family heavy metal efflux RND transporter [Marinilabiliales bacterium]|nr:MAG: CusA/CzcA family heavy metal efflux RND transporter [Marinilabiliales bacterium]